MVRVRFAPSPTGYLHIGIARTFIFNWLYARRHGGTMILRIDDTDLERNTEQSLQSIFDELNWLNLGWDEQYRQSDRLAGHKELALSIREKGLAYRDFTPMATGETSGQWLFNPGQREIPREESDRRPASGEPFAVRFRVPRDTGESVQFHDLVYGGQSRLAADIEDFALLRSNRAPMYHLASCADDIDLRNRPHHPRAGASLQHFQTRPDLSRGRFQPPVIRPFASSARSRRRQAFEAPPRPRCLGNTYRDGGFLEHAYINFLCLLGWSPKDDRERMTRAELVDAVSFEGVNRSNAVVNFSDQDPFDPKPVWLNAEHIRTLACAELAARLQAIVHAAGFQIGMEQMMRITPLIQERIRLLGDVLTVGDFFFLDELHPYDSAELIPKKGDAALARRVLEQARETLAGAELSHDGLETALRGAAERLGIKAGQMFEPVRVAVCGRKTAPPLFGTLEVLGRETCLKRIGKAIEKL